MIEEKEIIQQSSTMNINIRPYVVVRTVFLVIGTLMFVNAIGKMTTPITLILTSLFLAIALNPPVSRLSKIMPKGSRALSVAVAYLLVVGLLGTLLFTIVPPVSRQIGNFANQAPTLLNDAKDNTTRTGKFIERFNLQGEVDKIGDTVQDKLGDAGQFAFNSAQTAFGALLNVITVLVLTFLMLVDGPIMVRRLFEKYKDEELKERHEDLLKKMYRVITGYFNGQVLVSSINASLALIAMLLVGRIFGVAIPYPLVLTVLVWLCGLIPLIGAALGAAIVVSVTAFASWKVALVLAIYFFIYQQTENATIQPKIQGKAVSMSPLIVLIVVMLGASLGGFFAAFVALPVAGCLQLLFNDFISGGNLGKGKRSTPNNWLSRTISIRTTTLKEKK
ncbi:MAG: AI-2E family transporter [Candidatus Nomurabacteria bacterium]|nr:MAG: AI-2E family transporter [Candidatus Nomurabacteria bacterium]